MANVTAGYVWASGETVTPTKLNSAAAPTVVVADNEITTAKILDANVTAAKLAASLDLSSKTVTLPDASVGQAKLAANIAGSGPIVFASSATNQSIPNATFTKVTLGTEDADTNNNFASSRFTPTVAGYYQFAANSQVAGSATSLVLAVYKNGATNLLGSYNDAAAFRATVDGLIFMNGSTDYAELFAWHNSGVAKDISSNFNACLIRAA
jgi:hypothetical protein